MIRDEIHDYLTRHPFEPFCVRLSSGHTYEIDDPALAAVLKSSLFIAFRNSDRRIIIPFLHIAAVETTNDGASSSRRRRKHG